ncbi:MAG: hypothetical protein GY758_13510 [Fuerstiella sp.]|nr:hypothetical protein [Fuerstiella sp.]MCP4511386.1 hypothetical protein [Fuerstiella sp.]
MSSALVVPGATNQVDLLYGEAVQASAVAGMYVEPVVASSIRPAPA